MNSRRIVDTNLIVRHLVQDNEKHARTAAKLFEACDRGEVTVIVLGVVLAECVFVLESFYKHPRDRIADALSALISSPGVEMEEAGIYLDALRRYRATPCHFVDCIVAAAAVAGGAAVATFDRDFRRFADVHVEID